MSRGKSGGQELFSIYKYIFDQQNLPGVIEKILLTRPKYIVCE